MQSTNKIEKEEHINESGFKTDWAKYISTIEPNQYIIDKELAESLALIYLIDNNIQKGLKSFKTLKIETEFKFLDKYIKLFKEAKS